MKLVATVFVVALLAAGCGDTIIQTPTPMPSATPAPDRVVGLEIRCDIRRNDGEWHEFVGRTCVDSFGAVYTDIGDGSVAAAADPAGSLPIAFNRRQIITVLTGKGTIYTVGIPLTSTVKLGDPWPPP